MTHYAVLGDPVQHSLSPQIFKFFTEQTGQALDYQAILVKPEALSTELDRLREQGYKGVNLTTPHKEKAVLLVDVCSEQALMAKAINLIRFNEDGTVYGDNSDGVGFIRDLAQRKKYQIKGKDILMVGAGGAARGIMPALLKEQPRQVIIVNRTEQKARLLMEDFQGRENCILLSSWQGLQNQRFDLVINCTAAGLQGERLPLPAGILKAAACCYDLAYGKSALPFLNWAQEQGRAASCYDGLGMLVEQAAESYYLWCQKRVAADPVLWQLSKMVAP